MGSLTLDEATMKIKTWAIERNLQDASSDKQFLKLIEEVGELSEGLQSKEAPAIIDAIGDIYVVLTILAMQQGLDIEMCINSAYNEIKDRKGKMVNGVFVKEK